MTAPVRIGPSRPRSRPGTQSEARAGENGGQRRRANGERDADAAEKRRRGVGALCARSADRQRRARGPHIACTASV